MPFQPKTTVYTKIEQLAHLMMKGRKRVLEISGHEPETMLVPIRQDYLDWLMATSEIIQIALAE